MPTRFTVWALAPLLLVAVAVGSASAQNPARDTVVVVQRDTLVVVKKDTVFFQVVDPADRRQGRDYPRDGRPRRDRDGGVPASRDDRPRRYDDDDGETVAQRRERLRDARRREYEEWVASQPVRRPAGETWAFKVYPTTLLQLDFPALTLAAERTYDGRFAWEGQFGLAIRPHRTQNFGGGFEPGRARYGLRGITTALGGRYYFGPEYNRFPFYIGGEFNYAISPIELGVWVRSADGAFEQNVDVPVNAQRIGAGLFCGWELRSEEGFLLDLSTGLSFGIKGLYSSNEDVRDALSERYWNLPNGSSDYPYIAYILRVGVGYGGWAPRAPEADEEQQPRRRSRGKRRGKRRRWR